MRDRHSLGGNFEDILFTSNDTIFALMKYTLPKTKANA